MAILTFIKFNNFGSQHLNGPRHLFHSFCCTTWRIFEPLRVYEPGFNMDKYGILILAINDNSGNQPGVILKLIPKFNHNCVIPTNVAMLLKHY